MKLNTFIILFALIPCSIYCQNKSLPTVSIRNTEVREIKSKIVEGMTYEIHISLPENYEKSKDTYPVVYYLDAFSWGGTVIETYRLLRAFDEIQPLILIGISYKEATDQEASFYRSRDFIPTQITEKNTGSYSKIIPPASGGASEFLKFIKEELKPMIASHYRVNENNCAIFGISTGALFASYAMFSEPNVFNKYLLGSPRFDRDNFVILEFEEKYHSKNDSLPVKVFLSVGTEDWEFIILSWTKLRDRLIQRNYKGLELVIKAFDGENHTSCIPATISRGFRELYRKSD